MLRYRSGRATPVGPNSRRERRAWRSAPSLGRGPFSRTIGRRAAFAPHTGHHLRRRTMGIFGIIGTIIVGFIVGWIATKIMPGAEKLGFWLTTALGVGGSIVGGVISSLIFKSPDGKFHPAGWVLSIIGALVILWGYINFVK